MTLTPVYSSTRLSSISAFLTFLAGLGCHSGVSAMHVLGYTVVVVVVGVPGYGYGVVVRTLVVHRGTGPGGTHCSIPTVLHCGPLYPTPGTPLWSTVPHPRYTTVVYTRPRCITLWSTPVPTVLHCGPLCHPRRHHCGPLCHPRRHHPGYIPGDTLPGYHNQA